MASLTTSVGLSFPNSACFKAESRYHFTSSPPSVKAATRITPAKGLVRRYFSRRTLVSPNLRIMASAVETEQQGVKIVRNPSESQLSELGVRSWPKWGCPPSKFPWTYSSKETCYLLEGKVKVYPEGSDKAVEIGAGDLVVFPKGMSCTWDVSKAVDKHYQFE
ncbi:uncharacterized protein LOC127240654 [Andrographis paniculata]|uniref:uncharacterized protein LOC127240654 n=1 Tax=Andrographis paniculata TaxID=175694 RepID=UPI0021E98ECD|nr:uncharacterized protein LOC127240654 [Andrographis paniculata]